LGRKKWISFLASDADVLQRHDQRKLITEGWADMEGVKEAKKLE